MSWVKIKNALMTRAVNHPQVNSFGTGDPLAIGTDNVINLRTSDRDRIAYPLVFADVISAQAGRGVLTLTVQCYWMDRVEDLRGLDATISGSVVYRWTDNEDEVLSDQLRTAQDFIASLTDDSDEIWTLQDSVALTRFVEARDDKVAGWTAALSFDIPWGHSVCEIPT